MLNKKLKANASTLENHLIGMHTYPMIQQQTSMYLLNRYVYRCLYSTRDMYYNVQNDIILNKQKLKILTYQK